MDLDLQKEIGVIWPHLSQKTLDLLVPIHKGKRSILAATGQHNNLHIEEKTDMHFFCIVVSFEG